MNQQTADALDGDILLWKERAKGNGRYLKRPLCEIYKNRLSCDEECPVVKDRKMEGCEGTPFWVWYEATRKGQIPKAKEAAVIMLELLESLREEGSDELETDHKRSRS